MFAVAATAAENEANVRHALNTYPCLQLVPAEPRVGGPGLTGPEDEARFAAVLTAAAGSCADQPTHPAVLLASQEAAAAFSEGASHVWWLTEEQANMVQRFYPHGQNDTIGFFAAKFKKVCSVQ
jgi:16S rRNA C967 or C1407 C5-methylase (RsmB/RsmF family)